jgi:hypothetical protein
VTNLQQSKPHDKSYSGSVQNSGSNQEQAGSVILMLMYVSMDMIRPKMNGNMGLRIVRTMKKPMNRDHGRLLQEYARTLRERK